MINILEAVDLYNDTWLLTFYFVLGFSLVIGTAWTYYQMFVRGEKKKQPLKENIIYNQSDDVIENYDLYPKKKENQVPINNYQLKNFDTISENIFDDIKENATNQDVKINNEIEDPYKDISIDDNNLNNENTKTKQADEHQDNDIIVKDNLINKSEDLNITNNMNTSNERQKKKTNKKSNNKNNNKNKYYYKTNKKNNNYYHKKHH